MGTMFDEIHTLNGKAVSIVLWDMADFDDNIDILRLSAKALEVEYLLLIFALGADAPCPEGSEGL